MLPGRPQARDRLEIGTPGLFPERQCRIAIRGASPRSPPAFGNRPLRQSSAVLITGARVVDGTGSSRFYADIGIRSDSIAAIGLLSEATAEIRVDAHGPAASPTFIGIFHCLAS